jgi:hypothetical protein
MGCTLVVLAGDSVVADNAPAQTREKPAASPIALPALQPGLWEFRRTLTHSGGKPKFSSVKKCADPSADIARKMEELKRKSCSFMPARQEHGHYASSWICPAPSGPMYFRDVLTVTGAAAYEDVSEARMGTRFRLQKIEAQRTGDCPASALAPVAPGSAR